MKIYVAAKFDRKEEVRQLYKEVEARGHRITADWTTHKPIKPYADNPDIARQYAIEDINGVLEADIFVLLIGPCSTGVYTELGAAIHSQTSTGKPLIYVVGENPGASMFFFHPSVEYLKTKDELIEKLGEE